MRRRALFVTSMAGQGHIVRCRALACELASRGWASTMSNKAPSSAASYDVSIVDLGDEPQVVDVYRALVDRPVVAVADTYVAPDVDLIVWGSAGAGDFRRLNQRSRYLAGPQYSLLRPEFCRARWALGSTRIVGSVDLRTVRDQSATELAADIAAFTTVYTYGGMRAMEAACVRGSARGLVIEARNPGEELNKAGLEARPDEDLVDGLGCSRVADAIEELCA